jgi:hypothetical protein
MNISQRLGTQRLGTRRALARRALAQMECCKNEKREWMSCIGVEMREWMNECWVRWDAVVWPDEEGFGAKGIKCNDCAERSSPDEWMLGAMGALII